MAGPSSITESDALIALRLQLLENGGGNVPFSSLLDLPQHEIRSDVALQADAAIAHRISSEDLRVVRDSVAAEQFANNLSSSPTDRSDAHKHGTDGTDQDNKACMDVLHTSGSLPAVQCPICTDFVPSVALFKLSSTCSHAFCKPCMRTHLAVVATETKQYPLKCPMCRSPMPDADCVELLRGAGKAYIDLEKLVIERKHMGGNIKYCSNEQCGEAFEFIDDPQFAHNTDRYKVECMLCHAETCVQCKVPWHEDRTCEQYVTETRARRERQGDEAMRDMARRMNWTACPRCGALIERRNGDCNFVMCRCGCGFCHRCGKEYRSLEQTRLNAHGRPNCDCMLFSEQENVPPQPVHPQPARPALRVGPAPNRPDHRVRFHDNMDYDENENNEEDEDEIQPVYNVRPVQPRQQPVDRDRDNDIQADGGGDRVMRGANGVVSLADWLRRGRLPQHIHNCVNDSQCPYHECRERFVNLYALEQHLTNVGRHDVWLCCGRPFLNEHAYTQHRDAVHGY